MRICVVGAEAASDHEAALVRGAVVDADLAVCDSAEVALDRSFAAAWVHGQARLSAAEIGNLRELLDRGGGVLLSLEAVALAAVLGADAPAVRPLSGTWRNEDDPWWPLDFRDWPDYPHLRGIQGWPGSSHPLFAGLMGGAFTWNPQEGEELRGAVIDEPQWPQLVVGVERAYVQLIAGVATAWELAVGKGRILCLGANVRLAVRSRRCLSSSGRLLANAFRYAAGRRWSEPSACWPSRRIHAAVSFLPSPVASDEPLGDPGDPGIEINEPDDSPVTLAGEKVLVAGSEDRGVRELWIHPLRIVAGSAMRAGLGKAEHCEISPGFWKSTLRDGVGQIWTERVVVSPDEPLAHIELSPSSAASQVQDVGYELKVGLRLQWPMPVDALVPQRSEVRTTGRGHSVLLTGRDGRHVAMISVSGAAVVQLVEDESNPRVLIEARGRLTVSFSASSSGVEELARSRASAAATLERRQRRTAELKAATTDLTTPEETINEAWQQARNRLAGFVAAVPGSPGGRGLMAGYASSGTGWGEVRPGYAWFFGRDSCWTLDAMLALGMFDEARDAITLLAGSRDPGGKIIHELTTSGVAHYDAADSTPLFLRAVATWAEWTGDLGAVAGWWEAVEDGFGFTAACDLDGDGLPENTGVGHGWVESGPLGGGETTSYVAAIWIDALRRLEPLAAAMGKREFAADCENWRRMAEAGIEALRPGPGMPLAIHRRDDGSLDATITALHSVPVFLGVERPDTGRALMDRLAADSFSVPWGLRIISGSDPRYDPGGYHSGAVWPLFTGWAALADYRGGAVDRGVARSRSIAALVRRGNKGAFDEVLDGDTGEAAGVTADQAWSAAMGVTPIVLGLGGVRPVAYRGEIGLSPALPSGWSGWSIRNLRVGSTRLSIEVSRGSGSASSVQVEQRGGARLAIIMT